MARASFDRRTFLGNCAAGAAALAKWPSSSLAAETDAAKLIAGKDTRLIVHNTKTLEIETPLSLLREHRLTPKNILFVRDNQELAGTRTLKPLDDADWQFEIVGLVENPRTVTLEKLRDMEQAEVEMVLQCSGNGRANFARAAAVKGSPWSEGALANVRFGGVRLKRLFDSLDLGLAPDAQYVTAEGKEGPPKPADADFEHSLPLDDVLSRSIVALTLNGEPIPAAHGGPVRLVTPGYYGTMHVKWLSRLRLETRETYNHHQRRRYRAPRTPIEPGSNFNYDFDNSDANWRMRIKSTIFSPLDGESVSAGEVEVRGVAFNDGDVKIDAVELSLDDGRSWRRAEIERPESPYAWYPWTATLTLKKGKQRLLARAVDALGRTQPLDGAIGWNPAGYAWNGVHRVEFRVG
ncbi:MAG TPA: sulfite oxidase [Pirellulales bacterium]|nr:sulfite oxidase [Pirellulales bacterium]